MKTKEQITETFNSINFQNRNWLIQMREASLEQANIPALDDTWRRAFLELSDAFDRIDSMVARTEIKN